MAKEKSTLFLFEEYVKKNEVKYYETLKEELHKFRFVDKNFFSYLENMVNECLDEAKEREKKKMKKRRKKKKPMKNSQRLCRIYELVTEWNKLTDEFCKLKEETVEECEEEGYPATGYNHDLRLESLYELCEDYYSKRFDEIGEELYSLGYDLGKLK